MRFRCFSLSLSDTPSPHPTHPTTQSILLFFDCSHYSRTTPLSSDDVHLHHQGWRVRFVVFLCRIFARVCRGRQSSNFCESCRGCKVQIIIVVIVTNYQIILITINWNGPSPRSILSVSSILFIISCLTLTVLKMSVFANTANYLTWLASSSSRCLDNPSIFFTALVKPGLFFYLSGYWHVRQQLQNLYFINSLTCLLHPHPIPLHVTFAEETFFFKQLK